MSMPCASVSDDVIKQSERLVQIEMEERSLLNSNAAQLWRRSTLKIAT